MERDEMTWRNGSVDPADRAGIDPWERAAYEYAEQHALSRRGLLKAAGAGVGGLLFASALAACGSDASPGGGTAGGGGGGGDNSKLVLARGQASDTLDPQKTALLVAHEITWQIYDSLIYLDAAGRVFPGLATEWRFSNDKKTITFRLREGVTFHDGTPFDARAVKASVDRWLDPKTASPTAYVAGPLKETRVVDELTIEYVYREAFVPVLVGLSYSYGAPVSPTAAERYGDQFGRNPVGTGPYKFVEWTADETIKLERNEAHDWATPLYSGADGELARGPVIQAAEFRVIPENATRIAALTSKQIDMISGTEAVPNSQVEKLRETGGVTVVQAPAVGVYYANLNASRGPLADVRVRQAVNYAVDKDALVKLALSGQGKPATSIVSSAYTTYYDDAVEPYAYDPERARALLQEAGQGGGFTMRYLVIQGDEFERAAQVVQEQLSQVGVKVEITALPVGDIAATAAKERPDATFFYYTWNDPDIARQLLTVDGPLNFSWQDDPELDTLLQKQSVTFDTDERVRLFKQAQQRIADQAYYLMLWEGLYSVAARDYVKNIHIDTVGFIHLQELERG